MRRVVLALLFGVLVPGCLAEEPPPPPALSPAAAAYVYAASAPPHGLVPSPAPILAAPLASEPPRGPAAAALAFARAQVGHPYCWGGVGPACFDCSGLAMEAWLRGGVRLPRSADDMVKVLPSVPLRDARPGDLLWWPGHVALYAGDGWTVEALDRRSGVVMRRAPKPKRVLRVAG